MCPKRVTQPQPKSPEKALSSLMALCARAERSSGDAKRLMSRWGVEAKDQGAVLQRLIDERFIDDERYAAAYVREKINLNGWGVGKIRMELIRKGVSSEIISAQLSEVDRDRMKDRLDELMAKRVRTVKYNSKYHLRDKLIRYGASLGYDFSTVREAADKALSQIDFADTEEDELF